ncbi:uncharacterized protein LOC143920421 [Arctopsyche grandis]|uniref:uncharacterized protein LOC143920421 n=1 Tax=Arctopsyche grandis TaxID=121162 RepID=UPI00406D9483
MSNKGGGLCKSHGGVADERVLLQNYMISKLSRSELEDRYYSLWNSNIGLKKRLNSQDEKLKFLNTKLARLTNQQKKDSIISNKCCRDFEDIIEEQAFRIHQLQKFNYNLIEKIEYLETQISTLNTSHIENNNYVEKFKTENMKDNSFIYGEIFEPTSNKEYSRSLEPITENDVESMEEKVAALEKEIEILKDESFQRTSPEKSIVYDTTVEKSSENRILGENEINQQHTDAPKTFNHTYTQTESDVNNEIKRENEILNKKLAEEQLKILELQQKIESNNLKDDILQIVQNRLDTLNEKMTIGNDDNETKAVLCAEEHKTLEKELCDAKINIESLKVVNKQLGTQILELQTKVDKFSLQNKFNISKKLIAPSKSDQNSIEVKVDNAKNKEEKNENMQSLTINECNQLLIYSNSLENELKNSDAIKIDDNSMQKVEIHAVETNSPQKSPENAKISSENADNNSIQLQQDTEKASTPNYTSPKDLSRESINVDNTVVKSVKENHSDSSSDVLLNDATYDISTNDSSQCSNTPMNSLSEGYLSDGEIRKESVINFQLGKSMGSTLSQFSNVKVTSKPTPFFDEHEKSMKNTIDEITKEMEKCEKLLNRDNVKKLCKQKSVSANFPSMDHFNAHQMGTFIFHIVSVELTREAMALLESDLYFLTWKFYNEIVAYTPLYRNKISNFNFCSTYNVFVDDDFIAYLSTKSIQIDIHQAAGETSKLLACCEINLFDVLNKVNEKVDFVLNLEKSTEGNDNLIYGVLNCWCKLTWDGTAT